MLALVRSGLRPLPPAGAIAECLVFAVVVGYGALLAAAFQMGFWLVDTTGQPKPTDFLNVWAAGRLALSGAAASAYDWSIHKQAEVAAVGPFAAYYGWHYPPPFLMVAAALALLPYTFAHLVWMAASAPAYVAAVRLASGRTGVTLAALAFPPTLWNVVLGQNGFLTAGLLGAGLALLEKRPALAGVLIGLLTYKPQFGLLIPLALVAGGCWRAIAAAAATALALAGLSAALFGAEAWTAFATSMPITNEAVLVAGRASFIELNSLFGVIRAAGGGLKLAWGGQIALAATLATAVWLVWRGRADFALKAALLATAAVAASPYVYVYDLVALAIPVAFLARRGLAGLEWAAIVAASAMVLVGPFLNLPLGFGAVAIVGALVMRRIFRGP